MTSAYRSICCLYYDKNNASQTYLSCMSSEAEFLDQIQTKVFRAFLLAIHSHLYSFALRYLFLQTHATSYSFYSELLYCVHYKGENHNAFPMV